MSVDIPFNDRIQDTDTACRSIVTETAAEYEQEMDVFSADVSSEAAVTLEMKVSTSILPVLGSLGLVTVTIIIIYSH